MDMAEAYPDPPSDDSRPFPDVGDGDDSPMPPAGMVAGVSSRLSSVSGNSPEGYAQEYRLKLLHRMLLRNLPLDMIAQSMQISVTEVTRLRRELYRRLKREAYNLDIATHAGRTLSFYDEVRGTAMKMASDNSKQFAGRVKSLAVALQAEADKHQFLKVAGFYDHVKLSPKSGDEDASGQEAMTLGDIARAILDPSSDLATLTDMELEQAGISATEDDLLLGADQDNVNLL